MKKNDTFRVKIDSITNLGFGVTRCDGVVTFISGAVPSDIVEVKIIKVMPSYAVGRVEKYIEYSSDRATRCENSQCQSCAYKNISYEEELRIKREDVIADFKKEGLSDIEICHVTPSPKESEYRNKAQYPIAMNKDGEYAVGFFAPKSHRVTEARYCPLSPSVFGEIIDELCEYFKENSLSVYNEENGAGLLRHVYLRRGEVSGEILLTLVINGDSVPNSDNLITRITEKFPDTVGILLSINRENTNVVLGDEFITLYGRDHIFDTLSGVNLKITAPSFYQVNHDACELLYAKAKELAAPQKNDILLDLYCGAGSIGLSMAEDVGELIGIEIVESAVICARENSMRCGIDNAKFFVGDAKETEKLLANAETQLGRKIEPNIVILDPPRAGCSEELIKYVSSLSPERIVYISCNPRTLARDVKLFREFGYKTDKVELFDLFAKTGHVESVVCLTRRTN